MSVHKVIQVLHVATFVNLGLNGDHLLAACVRENDKSDEDLPLDVVNKQLNLG